MYADFLNSWNWEWFCTLTFPEYPRFSENKVNECRLNWTRLLSTEESLQVGYIYSLVYKDCLPHLHLLMIGKNRDGKTLSDVNTAIWENEWPYRARIELPESNLAVASYLDKNISWSGSDLGFYNSALLKRMKNLTYEARMDF